jgi:hypothetical protein
VVESKKYGKPTVATNNAMIYKLGLMLTVSFHLDEGTTGRKNTLTISKDECNSICHTGDNLPFI